MFLSSPDIDKDAHCIFFCFRISVETLLPCSNSRTGCSINRKSLKYTQCNDRKIKTLKKRYGVTS